MITGYKKKKLGRPSEKLSGDVPRAGWRAVLLSEVVMPIVLAVLFVIAYMFVKSFPTDGIQPPSPLIRIAFIAVGPVVWNATVLLTLFFVSLFLGPMMGGWVKFGSVIAATAHFLALLGMVAFFEFFVSLITPSHLVIANNMRSGSWSSGISLTQCLVSSLLSPFSARFRRS